MRPKNGIFENATWTGNDPGWLSISITFHSFHTIVVEDSRIEQNRVRARLYNFRACVYKSNVEIRIAGSSCRSQNHNGIGWTARVKFFFSSSRSFFIQKLHRKTFYSITRTLTTVNLHTLLYIELAISFLIGRMRTVNFRNQRPWRHNCRLYNNHVKVKSNHVKVTGNHVMYDRGAWVPSVIMSSSRALCFSALAKK